MRRLTYVEPWPGAKCHRCDQPATVATIRSDRPVSARPSCDRHDPITRGTAKPTIAQEGTR